MRERNDSDFTGLKSNLNHLFRVGKFEGARISKHFFPNLPRDRKEEEASVGKWKTNEERISSAVSLSPLFLPTANLFLLVFHWAIHMSKF